MRAVQWQAPQTLTHAEVDDPVPTPGQAVIAVSYSGVCGSDLHAYHSGYGVQAGQVLDHEFSGRVLAAPGVEGLSEGQRVAVRPIIPCGSCARCGAGEVQECQAAVQRFIGFGEPGAFAEKVLVPVAITDATVFPLPDAVDDLAGALVEPLAVARRAVVLAGEVAGRPALVLGAGMIGLGVARLLHLSGAAPIVVSDPSSLRRDRARQLGATDVLDPRQHDPVAAVRTITGPWAHGRGARAAAVVDCAGAPGTFQTAIDAAGQGGTVVVAAMGPTRADIRPDVIAVKELTVRGSLTYRGEFPEVIAMLAGGSLRADAFISHTVPLARIQEGFALQREADTSLKVLISPLTERLVTISMDKDLP